MAQVYSHLDMTVALPWLRHAICVNGQLYLYPVFFIGDLSRTTL